MSTYNGDCDYPDCHREATTKITHPGCLDEWYCRRHAEPEARDSAAEKWLVEHHDQGWTLGNATRTEWEAAYAAVDAS